MYHADLPEQNDVAIREALDTFKSNYKLLADESKRNVEGIRTGLTRLRKYSRDGGERGETSYEQKPSAVFIRKTKQEKDSKETPKQHS